MSLAYARDLRRHTSPRHSRRQSEMVYYRQRSARRVGAQTDPARRSRVSFARRLKREPPRFLSGRARRPQAVSYSLTQVVFRYRGLVILTKPIIAQTAANTTKRLKNAPTPRAIVRSAEFWLMPRK